MDSNQKIPFLVISANPFLRGILKFVLESLLMIDATELENEEKALNYLRNLEIFPSMIVYDYTPDAYLLEDFIVYLREFSKDVHIVVLTDEVTEEARDFFRDIPQLVLIKKSDLPDSLLKQSKKVFSHIPFQNVEEFCQIDSRFLSILDGVNKNLFVKIGPKFVCLFNEDDNTEAMDIQKYMNKGVQAFYFNRSTALWIIGQIQKQMALFLKSNNFRFVMRGANETEEKRLEQKILRLNDEVHIDYEFKVTIDETISKVKKVIEKEKHVDKLLQALKGNKEIFHYYNHKVMMTALVSSLMAKQLDWSSRLTLDKLVYASTICDLTLALKPELLKIRSLEELEIKKSSFSPNEYKLYLKHPKEGADLIKNYFPTSPPETDILALQHHEMPAGDGFPHGLKADRISPLSALFIIANDFSSYYLENEDPSVKDFISTNESRYDSINFRKILKALEKIQKN